MAYGRFVLLCICSLVTLALTNGQYYGSKYSVEHGEKYERSYWHRKFPKDFMFGAATSAFQVEGGWDADGKQESVWDYNLHITPAFGHNDSADVACDSYYEYQRDIQMAKELGLSHYRFSISWPRILNMYTVNQAGIDYYNNLIDGLLEEGIQPLATMFHWDLPALLQTSGGLANPLFVDYFVYYARVLFDHFGDRVKYWITINEAFTLCGNGYGTKAFVPALNSSIAYAYCSRHALLGHAKVYELYDNYYRKTQNGMLSMAFIGFQFYPVRDCEEDRKAADEALAIYFLQYVHPIFSEEGDWPKDFKKAFARYSKSKGYGRSILPQFTRDEIELIRGSADYFGLNIYSGSLVCETNYEPANEVAATDTLTSLADVLDIRFSVDPEWPQSAASWLYNVPCSIYDILMLIKEEYRNPLVIVTENGWSTTGEICDEGRVDYMRGYMNAMYDAMEDGCNVGGYTAWSLMDNFEWNAGYSQKFGLYSVNFTDPMRTRTPKLSAKVYSDIIRTRTIDPYYWPIDMNC